MLEELEISTDLDFNYDGLSFNSTNHPLPNLRSFGGTDHEIMISLPMIMTISRLTITCAVIKEFDTFFDSISTSLLPQLTELDLDISLWPGADMRTVIPHCATVCSSLEVWLGSLPQVVMTGEELGELFGLFGKLRVIHLDSEMFSDPKSMPSEETNTLATAFVGSLAASCRALQQVCLTYQCFNWEQWWVIDSDSTARLQKEH
jgi:hypothetical protein